jgi:hypothetical protein
MVRLTIPGRIPAAASHFPAAYRQRRENGKGAEPESPVFGNFREKRESGPAALVGGVALDWSEPAAGFCTPSRARGA